MATKTKKTVITPEEAREKLPRRAKRWIALSNANMKLSAKKKAVEKDLKALTKVLPGKKWENTSLRCKHVPTKPVKKKDDDNIALVKETVKKSHLALVITESIDSEALEALYPDLHAKLERSKGSRFEIDVLQAHQE